MQKRPRSDGGDATFPSDEEIVWFVTENPNKFKEAKLVLARENIPLRHLKQAKVELQRPNLKEVAKFAVKHVSSSHKGLFLVEDSGLFIEALNGFPGPFSSYTLATIGLRGLLRLMRPVKNRTAYFQSALAVGSPSVKPLIFSGTVHGKISHEIRGREGFGYDPIFVPVNSDKTFAESGLKLKNMKSHRAKAFRRFSTWYNSRLFIRKNRTN